MATVAATPRHPSDWRHRLGAKLVDAHEAVSHIGSGDRVAIAIAQATPFTLCTALAGRLMETENVVVNHTATLFNWDLPGLGERFRLESMYLSPFDRPLHNRMQAEYTPLAYFREGHLPPTLDNFNVYMMTVTPPDERGYVNFGEVQIMSKLLARNANLVIAEVDESFYRMCGDNQMHVSEIDYFVERTIPLRRVPMPPLSDEEARVADTICRMVAKEIIHDGATIQIGIGSVSGVLAFHLRDHHDLGMQTEIIPHGTTHLVRDGVLTGKKKKVFPGLVVGSAFALATPLDELEFADGNPGFQLYDFNLTDDIRLIAREEGIVSVNNALQVDLTGQVNSESLGPMTYSGTGGQTAFIVGACMAGGTTVIVTPSSSMVKGTRRSRIVTGFPAGTVLTATRPFVHDVVTEYGIARLKGKSIRDRANELVAVAHPDFRAELKAEAKRLYG